MIDYNFIRYKKVLSTALIQDESPEVTENYLGSIQLKPNDPEPYVQLSNFDFGLVISTYKVYVVRFEDCTEVEITNNVTITTFVENGVVQGRFQYTDIPVDFGNGLVYIKIDLHGNGIKFLYSNLIRITDTDVDKTTRIDYLDNTRKGNETELQSTRIVMYKHNHISNTEIDSYYQISTEQNVNSRILENSLQEYYIPPINAWTFKRIEKAFYNGGFWLDKVRNYLTAPIEYVERQESSNVSEQMFTTDPSESNTINIIKKCVQVPTDPMLGSTIVVGSTTQLGSEVTTCIIGLDNFIFNNADNFTMNNNDNFVFN